MVWCYSGSQQLNSLHGMTSGMHFTSQKTSSTSNSNYSVHSIGGGSTACGIGGTHEYIFNRHQFNSIPFRWKYVFYSCLFRSIKGSECDSSWGDRPWLWSSSPSTCSCCRTCCCCTSKNGCRDGWSWRRNSEGPDDNTKTHSKSVRLSAKNRDFLWRIGG